MASEILSAHGIDANTALSAIFDALSQPMLLIDVANGLILRANAAAAQMHGIDADRTRGAGLETVSAKPAQLREALRMRRDHIPLSYHVSTRGKRLPVEITLRYLGNHENPVCLAAIRDLSQQHAHERARHATERKYQGIFGTAPYPILLLNGRREIVEANPAAMDLYGLDAARLDARPRLATLLADAGKLAEYFRPGVTRIEPHRHRRIDGEEFMAAASVAFSRDRRVTRWIAVIRNVSEEQEALAQLHAAEERWRFALEGPGTGVWEWNPDTDAFFVTPRFCEMLNLPEATEMDFGWWESRVHPDDQPRTNEAIMAHLTQAAPMIELEIRVRDGTGRHRWIELRAKGMNRDAYGHTQRVVGTARIIDAEREREQREREQAASLLHLDRLASMGEMATLIAHELNQPLTAISNFAAVARHRITENPAEATRALDLIQALVQRAGGIVRNVRGFAQKTPAERRQVSLNAVITDTTRFVEYQALAQEAQIRLELGSGLPAVPADPVEIGQLVLNLVKNGLDAMRDMPSPRRLTLRTGMAGAKAICLIVEDCGSGLPPEAAGNLFEPFFTTKADGLGMGLSICRTIVENHGGTLRAEANTPRGARFIALLPLE